MKRPNGDAVVVYFAHQSGRLVLAPDTRMKPEQCGMDPRHWRRCEAVGAREIEKISLILSATTAAPPSHVFLQGGIERPFAAGRQDFSCGEADKTHQINPLGRPPLHLPTCDPETR